MWSMVAQRLTQITPQAATPDPLWQRVEAAWSAVLQEHIQSLFESMPRCVAAVISNNGGYSGHRLWQEPHFTEGITGITFQDGDRFNSCQVIYSQFSLAIHQNDHQARRRFVEWAQNEIAVVPYFHKRILFSDEAHFWSNGYVNKQNCRIWSEANPQMYFETPLHPEKLTEERFMGWWNHWSVLLQKR
ncbi:transposable element Tcb1 transposase [Trichonephila clavipes]|uniref:Transposable element Tcb1 transposase n=1 Tax=Trichonephila clavipes TaxID=2585209 RepID=A0A8X7BGN9_TRICX|nr:transposable element Tcb1 transposase [Trichonephila clavipes]